MGCRGRPAAIRKICLPKPLLTLKGTPIRRFAFSKIPSLRNNLGGRRDVTSCPDTPQLAVHGQLPPTIVIRSAAARVRGGLFESFIYWSRSLSRAFCAVATGNLRIDDSESLYLPVATAKRDNDLLYSFNCLQNVEERRCCCRCVPWQQPNVCLNLW